MKVNNINFLAGEKIFISLKNQADIPYYNDAERLLMSKLEYDVTVDSYEPFKYTEVGVQSSTEPPVSLGFILQKNGIQEAVIVNDRLAGFQKPELGGPKPFLPGQKGIKPIEMSILRTQDITDDILANNTSVLYSFAVQPPPAYDDCLSVKDYFDFVDEAPIKRLKTLIQSEGVIYFLLFNYGLRAELSSEIISDEMIVTLGPLMGSILKKLVENAGVQINDRMF